MKRVVVYDDLSNNDIKPYDLLEKYLEISCEEVNRLLIDKANLINVKCPACESNGREFAFKKFGLNYVECTHCGTLYISPRPSEERIKRYFMESKSGDYWNEHILKKTNEIRIKHLVKPEAMWVANTVEELFIKPDVYLDLKSRSIAFLEEISNLNLFKTKMIINPESNIPQTLYEQKGFRLINEPVWNISTDINANVVTGFYVIDRLYDPQSLLNAVKSMLVDKGLLFLVSSTISGLDLQILWENSKTIFPPENLNVFSIEGIKILLERSGFEIVELSTPGQLDLEYIRTAIEHDKKLKVPRFISYILKNRDENAHRALQNFLQEFRLSSHLRVVARKR